MWDWVSWDNKEKPKKKKMTTSGGSSEINSTEMFYCSWKLKRIRPENAPPLPLTTTTNSTLKTSAMKRSSCLSVGSLQNSCVAAKLFRSNSPNFISDLSWEPKSLQMLFGRLNSVWNEEQDVWNISTWRDCCCHGKKRKWVFGFLKI